MKFLSSYSLDFPTNYICWKLLQRSWKAQQRLCLCCKIREYEDEILPSMPHRKAKLCDFVTLFQNRIDFFLPRADSNIFAFARFTDELHKILEVSPLSNMNKEKLMPLKEWHNLHLGKKKFPSGSSAKLTRWNLLPCDSGREYLEFWSRRQNFGALPSLLPASLGCSTKVSKSKAFFFDRHKNSNQKFFKFLLEIPCFQQGIYAIKNGIVFKAVALIFIKAETPIFIGGLSCHFWQVKLSNNWLSSIVGNFSLAENS